MAYWFKEGKDWIADPTGNTLLANNYLIDGLDGSDVTGTGTQAAPYKTDTYAISQRGTGPDIVYIYAPTIVYTPHNAFFWDSEVKGDGMVEFKGIGSEMVSDRVIQDSNFINIICNNCYPFFNKGWGKLYNVVMIDCIDFYTQTTNTTNFYDCLFINSILKERGTTIAGTRGFVFKRCKSINSDIKVISKGKIRGESCYFDISSSIIVSDLANDTSYLRNCNFRGSKISTGAIPFSDIFIETGEISQDPLYRNPAGGDYTISQNSPHVLAGYLLENIGGDEVSEYSEHQGQSALDIAVAANANISYSGTGGLVNSSGVDQNVDLSEFILPKIGYIGIFPQSGNENLHNVKLFVNWAGLDGIYGGYREFKFNQIPSQDDSNVTNGENLHSWAQINKIIAKKYKVRLIIKPSIA